MGAYSSHQREHKGLEPEEEKPFHHSSQIKRRPQVPGEMLRKRRKRRRRGFRGCGRPKLAKEIEEEGEIAGDELEQEKQFGESISNDSGLNGQTISPGDFDATGFDSSSSNYENSTYDSTMNMDSYTVDQDENFDRGNDDSHSMSDSQDNVEETSNEKNNDWMYERETNNLNGDKKQSTMVNETTDEKVIIRGETNSMPDVSNTLQKWESLPP